MPLLLTNDDGVDSPLFEITLKTLSRLSGLTAVVPRHEQSWRGKAMTRWEEILCEERQQSGVRVVVVDGTPADCVNLAIHRLLPEKPDIVISGVNIGTNTGIGFALSSGTLGACLEGNIAGVPAVAFSQALPPELFERWRKGQMLGSESGSIKANIPPLLNHVVDSVKGYLCDCKRPITLSVNLPTVVSQPPALRICPLSKTVYGSCFEPLRANAYRHMLTQVFPDPGEESDDCLLSRGFVTVSPVDIFWLCEVDEGIHAELAKLFC